MFQHFDSLFTAGHYDFRLGLNCINNPRAHQPLLNNLHMDFLTPFIPMKSLLHIARKRLHHCSVPPQVPLQLPLAYIFAMMKLDAPHCKPYQTNLVEDQHDLIENATTTTNHQQHSIIIPIVPVSDAMIEMSQHHVIPVHQHTRNKLPQQKQPQYSWKTSLSPLTRWIIDTTQQQTKAHSMSLRKSYQDQIYHNFLSLNIPYALQIHTHVYDINIFDARLHPRDFKRDLKECLASLHHLTVDDVFGLHSLNSGEVADDNKQNCVGYGFGSRETSKGDLLPQIRTLYRQYGNHLFYNMSLLPDFGPLITTVTTNGTATANNNNMKSKRQQPQPQQQQRPQQPGNNNRYSFVYTIPSPNRSTLRHHDERIPAEHSIPSSLTSTLSHISSTAATSLAMSSQATPLPKPSPPTAPNERSLSDIIFGLSNDDDIKTLDTYYKNHHTFRYSTVSPGYPTDNTKFNNLGRCYSLLRAMVANYHTKHLIPRYTFNPCDYRINRFHLLREINYTRQILLQPRYKNTTSWNQFFFSFVPSQRTKRQITAHCIATNEYRWPPEVQDKIANLQQYHVMGRDGQMMTLSQCPFTPTELNSIKSSLRRVYRGIDIYKGHTINQYSIAGLFSAIGATNWQYRGDHHLLAPLDVYQNGIVDFVKKLFK